MILKHILKSNIIKPSIFNNINICMLFVSGKKLLGITKNLVSMDSLQFDKISEQVLESYIRPGSGQIMKSKESQMKKDTNKVKNKNITNKKMGKLQNQWIKVQDNEAQKDNGNLKQEDIQNNKIKEDIKFLYDACSDAKIGFLKGDIHAQLVFKLNKYLSQKQPKQLLKDITTQQFKKILNLVTELKYFRIPKRGVRNSSKQDQKNMFQRQIILQTVSNQQSSENYDNVLDSLARIGKLHSSGAFRSYMSTWFAPLCGAIKQQQNKCKDQAHLQGSRKIYANDFIRLTPQKLTTVCLSELLKQITNILYRDYVRQGIPDQFQQQKQPQFQQYDSIRFKTLCLSIAKWVSVQSHYQEQQKQFKQVMKLYDTLNQSRKVQKNNMQSKKKQPDQPNKQQNQQNKNQQQLQTKTNPQQNIQQSQKRIKKQYQERVKQIQQTYNQKYVAPQDRKGYLQELANKLMRDHYKLKSDMSEQAQYQIGSILIYLMKQILKTQNRSGYKIPLLTLQHKYFKVSGQIVYDKRLKINDHFLNTILPIIQKQGDLFMHLDRSIPTMIPPMPWVEYQIGGYFLYPSTFMRFSQCKVQQRLVRYSDLSRVYNVLNQLSKTAWKINTKVLDVVQAIWVQGGKAGQIPKRYSQPITTCLTKLKNQYDWQQRKQLMKQIQKLRDEHSLRSDFNLKINLARSYSKLDRFYYPHNVDFRGRVYPIPPHLNHIGNDLSRGILMFADGKKLGQGGLKWLKIHCANLMGKDKATIPEKMEFIQANLGLIKAIAQDPLKNRQWLHNQDCWQSLGAIFQLDAALKLKNPTQYVSCLHIHQDGSCNGLQHYAAMGRDSQGAYQVNLGPSQRPGDVYTHVAKMVIQMINKDIADPQSKNCALAKKLVGQIKRKTIKQTVMTSVYGVTFIGARQQIYRQLKDQAFLKDDDEQYAASIYLAKLTLNAISNLFSSAHLIKKWFIQCAHLVANQGNPMGWITPMGLPVVQPYRKQSNLDVVNTIVQSLKIARRSQNLPVNKNKQKSAFPPNYVHSLDSTHMMYTAQKCAKQKIVFAAVHDSYWTHAATVDRMNQILRQQFIKLHSQPLLQNLKNSLQIRYPNIEFPEIPKRGDFDLQKIKQSIYFFS